MNGQIPRVRYVASHLGTDEGGRYRRKAFDCLIEEELLERERLRNISPDGSVYTLTVNAVSTDMLEQALAEAVKQEDYERASQLRDEIKRRKEEKETEEPNPLHL